MRGCVYCQVMLKYFKSLNLDVELVDIDIFVKKYITESERELFIKKIQLEGISMPYNLYTIDKGESWHQLDMSDLIKQHLTRYTKEKQSVK